jgi:opacity protein-like surface antigen
MQGIMMSRKLAVTVALSVTMLGAVPALANGGRDRVPAPIPVPAPMPIQESFSYYLRADLGWGFAGDPSFSESGAEFGVTPLLYSGLTDRTSSSSDVFHGSIGAGAYWTPRFRTDVTLDFRGTQDIDASATYTDPGPVDGVVRDFIKLRGTVGLFNAYWDLAPRGFFTPYIGAGVGFVHNQIDRTHVTTEDAGGGAAIVMSGSSSANNFGLAAAVMAGVSFSWSHGWVLDVGYRGLYMDGGDVTTLLGANASRVEIGSQWEHQVRVGLRANLW